MTTKQRTVWTFVITTVGLFMVVLDNLVVSTALPVIREAVAQHTIKHFALQNGVLGVAIFIPGADFPVLTLNQIRMVLRLAVAHGEELDRERAFEVLSVVAAGLGFRTLARDIVGLVPGVGWAVKGGVAYAATIAVGSGARARVGGDNQLEPGREPDQPSRPGDRHLAPLHRFA